MLPILTEIVIEAGKILKEGFYGVKEINQKATKDLVTDYDVRVEKFIIGELKKHFSDFSIIAEEGSVEANYRNPNKIIIDPIDGTTNFVHTVPHVAISLGVHKNNEPYIGIVYNPILDEFFYGIKGEGAFLNGKKINATDEIVLKKSLIATGFPYSCDKNIDDFNWVIAKISKILPEVQDIRRLGSASLDLCYLARGSFDGYYEMNLKPWDVAAGIIILEEAGGKVSNEKGEKHDIFKDKILLASNSKIHDYLVNYLS